MSGCNGSFIETETSGYDSDTEGPAEVKRALWQGGQVSRRRRERTRFTAWGLSRLEAVFALDRYPDIRMREDLATDLAVTEDRIEVWFQNRRSKLRKRQRNGRMQELAAVPKTQPVTRTSTIPSPFSSFQSQAFALTPLTSTPEVFRFSPEGFLSPPGLTSPICSPPTWSSSFPPNLWYLPTLVSPDVTSLYPREDATSICQAATPPSGQKFVRPWES